MPEESVRSGPLLQHDDEGYVRPDAWEEAKRAFGQRGDIAMMLGQLERSTLASPRLLLAVAIHTFLSKGRAEQFAAIRDYLQDSDGVGSDTLQRGDSRSRNHSDRQGRDGRVRNLQR